MNKRTYRTRPAGIKVFTTATSRPQFPLDQFTREMDAFAAVDEAIELLSDESNITATTRIMELPAGFKV